MHSSPYTYMKFLIFLWLIAAPMLGHAAVFVVTSNSDSGPGTLREAIDLAAANGTTDRDYINFNLSAGVTINLYSNLAALTSNIVIDGSTQPGTTLGASGAKVYLSRQVGYTEYGYYGLQIATASQIEIYGLVIKKPVTANYGSAILITGTCSDIIIGTAGKGNVINGYVYGIEKNSPERLTNITIQGNIIGWEEDGITANQSNGTYRAMRLYMVHNVKLGGNLPGEGNTIASYSYGTDLDCDGGSVTVSANIFGANIYGTAIPNFIIQPSVMLQIRGVSQEKPEEVFISDNLITGNSQMAISVNDLPNGIKILRNKIGTDITGQQLLGARQWGMNILNCGPGMVGGSLADKNIIAGCTYGAMSVSETYFLTISKNEMFCNNTYVLTNNLSIALYWQSPDNRPRPFIEIKTCDANTISGITVPNAKVEVFTPYRCDNSKRCDGRNYIETIMADGDGKWSYALNGRDGAVFSATDVKGATSDYTSPQWTYGGLDVIRHTSCGKSLGGIPTVVISNTVPFYWEDEAGNIVGRDTSLTNVPAGKYRLVLLGAGCNLPECAYKTNYFTVEEHNPGINTTRMEVVHATCGNKNGSINGLEYAGDYLRFSWQNAAGIEVSTDRSLTNIGPGQYTITITDSVHDCKVYAGPFEVKNESGPTLDVTGVVLKDAFCDKPTGSISGLQLTGSGTLTYLWVNSKGESAGSNIDLLNVPAGSYVLKFSDASSCGSVVSDSFYIRSPGLITIDKSKATIGVSDCGSSTGSVTGLKIRNGETFSWVNAAGSVVGNAVDLKQAAPGKYTLTVTNINGCSLIENFTIVQAIPSKMTMASATIINPVCNGANGQLKDVVITGGMPLDWKWTTPDGTVVGIQKELKDITEGMYLLFITDAAHCEQFVTTVALKSPPLPEILQGSVENDQCNLNIGAIHGITVSGVAPFTYKWFSNSLLVGNTQDLNGLHAGTYTLRIMDKNGCEVISDPLQISNSDAEAVTPRANNIVIVKGMIAEIKVNAPQRGSYYLYNNAGDQIANSSTGIFKIPGLVKTTIFQLGFEQGTCISNKSSVTVEVVDAIKIYVPTAFSPNGDGLNDYFSLKAYGIADFDLFDVYDRWGNKVFSTKDPSRGWDGTFRERKVPAGSYIWMLKAVDILGNSVQQQGAVIVVY